jgi:hypothetical protein
MRELTNAARNSELDKLLEKGKKRSPLKNRIKSSQRKLNQKELS